MTDNNFDLSETQKKLMELLVSRTLKKHGVKKATDLTDREKQSIKEMIQDLQKQSEMLINKQKNITEKDVNPLTNTYEEK